MSTVLRGQDGISILGLLKSAFGKDKVLTKKRKNDDQDSGKTTKKARLEENQALIHRLRGLNTAEDVPSDAMSDEEYRPGPVSMYLYLYIPSALNLSCL
jgi:hypothetical protein